MPLETMLRVYFLQQWFNLSEAQAGDMLCDSESMRRFAVRTADATTRFIPHRSPANEVGIATSAPKATAPEVRLESRGTFLIMPMSRVRVPPLISKYNELRSVSFTALERAGAYDRLTPA